MRIVDFARFSLSLICLI